MTDYTQTLNYARHPICPWCGKHVALCDGNVDHVFPRAEWKHIRRSRTCYENGGIHGVQTENDIRNRILVHRWCNNSKGCEVKIPSWSVYGDFRLWEVRDLKDYASYIYYWSELFIKYYAKLRELNKESAWCVSHFTAIVNSLLEFRKEYKHRLETDNWYIDQI